MKSQRIIIKIGTNAMTKKDKLIDEKLLGCLIKEIAALNKDNEVMIVTSGAMGCGRSLVKLLRYDDTTNRQIYAVVGQVKLMSLYSHLFKKYKINVAQLLSTKEDFTIRSHYLNTKNCLESLFKEKIVPIMNENDFIAVEELMFTDNDELAGMISKMLNADKIIILTNVKGVYDKKGKVIPEVYYNEEIPDYILNSKDKSSFGKGGIQTKFKVAQEAAAHGTEVFIVSSKEENVIARIMKGEKVGTKFVPQKFNA
jgi:glutamate 5-kinase